MLAAEVRQMDSRSKDLSLSAIRRTHVAQNMRYDEGVKAGYVAFLYTGLKARNTRPVTL
jgi:hypothetical protein